MNSSTYCINLIEAIEDLDIGEINEAVDMIREAWDRGSQIICMGNGGSALTAQHYITDWNKGLKKPFLGRCLVDNIGLITAYANDVSYDEAFERQLQTIMMPGDLVIGISGSGNSENVIRAISYANLIGHTLGICGFDGGDLKEIAQRSVWVRCNDMQIIEDIHLAFGHMVLRELGGNE
jgi:D-sedoheptulose 7-phosphate isomerase